MMSHILRDDKHFSTEAANELAGYIGLSEEETDYFFLLLSSAKAGTYSLQQRLKKKIAIEQKKANELTKRVKADQELPEVAKAVFYSNWLFTGVRNMTACPSFQNVDQIAKHLNVPRANIQKVLDFLLKNGLCNEVGGRIVPGTKQTHVGHKSPLVSRHHQNWRIQGFTKMLDEDEANLFFTAPMSLSYEAAEKIRKKLPSVVEEVVDLVRPSDSEVVYCLNMDWFKY
jgi:uncharacterized protein (TIGR02147 family)